MEDKNYETAIDINGPSSELKSDISDILSKEHMKNIEELIVSQYIDDQHDDNNYAVTYSSKDKSILGWTVNIEENEQQPDVYFKFDKEYNISSFVLYKKTLVFNYYDYYYNDNSK